MTIVGDKPGLLDQAPEREMARVMRGGPRRTPEAMADIEAARADPTGLEIAMQAVDRAAEEGVRELRDAPTAYRDGNGTTLPVAGLSVASCVEVAACQRCGKPCDPGLETQARIHLSCIPNLRHIPDDAIVLTGPDAARYRALQDAARAAHEATKAVVATNTALRDAFQAFCAGASGGQEP